MANRLLLKYTSFFRTTLFYTFTFLFFITLTYSCKKEPSVGPPDPPIDIIKNTINLSVEWTDLYRIKLKWNKAEDDKQNNYRYNLTRKDEKGNEITRTFYITGNDTSYIDDNNGDSLETGKTYIYSIKAYNNENELKDTSKTITAVTLSPTSHNIEWKVDTLGQPGDFLYDVWGLDENNVYAVGGINMPEGVTSIIKWDGERWNYHSWPEGGANGIWGFSENNIFVVGEWANRGFIGHFNGSTWTEYRDDYFLARGDTVYPLRSVWGSSPDNVWAVGSQGTIIHWNGSEWKKVEAPTQRQLTDIWGSDWNDIYAIGFSLINEAEVIHYDGVKWRNITSELNTNKRGFISVWVNKNKEAYAVGTSVIYFNGHNWNTLEINQSKFLTSVHGRNSADIITVGQRGRIHHFNGEGWKTYPELYTDTGSLSEIKGIIVFEKKIIGVGESHQGALVYTGSRK